MKKYLLISVAVLSAMSMNARQLTPREALMRATGNMPMSVGIAESAEPVLTVAADAGIGDVYVFNGEAGYAIVSANDVAEPLLGFSDSGMPLDTANIPDNMRYWLKEYARQIRYADEQGWQYTPVKDAPDRKYIHMRLSTQWNQSAPYNNLAPVYNGKRSVTGCVATALAQVMKYYNYPAKGIGTHTYTNPNYNQSVSFDFGNTTFDWANMLDTYNGSYTSTQANAVATLMKACGVAVEMMYSPNESGAYTTNVVPALVNFFGYDRSVRDLERDYYTISEWTDIIYNNLRDFGPVQYSGSSSDGAHSFVVDGYLGKGYFHVNWGWGGSSDGNYLLTALTPPTQGIGGSSGGYNYKQDAIIGLKKGNNGVSTGEPWKMMSMNENFGVKANTATLGQYVTFTGWPSNASSFPISGSLALKLIKDDGSISYAGGYGFEDLQPRWGYQEPQFYLPQNLSGNYTVSMVFETGDGEYVDVLTKLSSKKTLTMTCENGTATFTDTEAPNLAIHQYNVETPIYIGSTFNIKTTVHNPSDNEYYGAFKMILYNSSNVAVGEGATMPVNLAPDETAELDYTSELYRYSGKTISAGTHYIEFQSVETGQKISDRVQVNVGNLPSSISVNVRNLKVENASNVDAMFFRATADVTCTSGYFGGTLRLVIFPHGGTGTVYSVASLNSDVFYINNGQTKQIVFQQPFSSAECGKSYFCMVYSGSNALSNERPVFTVGALSAADDITVGQTDIPVYYTIDGQQLPERPTKPGLYIERKGAVTSKVIIR